MSERQLENSEAVEHRMEVVNVTDPVGDARFRAALRAIELPDSLEVRLELNTPSGGFCELFFKDRRELHGVLHVLQLLVDRSVAEGFITAIALVLVLLTACASPVSPRDTEKCVFVKKSFRTVSDHSRLGDAARLARCKSLIHAGN